MINIYGTNAGGTPTGWTTKITSLMNVAEYGVYDSKDYDQAQANLPWIVALEDGEDRLKIANSILKGSTFYQFFDGCNNLAGVDFGEGLVVGCCSLIRPNTKIGNQVYIGAGTIIDIGCTVGDGVTIGDNVTVGENVTIPANTVIPSGSVVTAE